LPTELESLFGDVPLVGRERREDYDAFFSAIAAAEVPIDAIDWMLLRDLVDLAWEIRRFCYSPAWGYFSTFGATMSAVP